MSCTCTSKCARVPPDLHSFPYTTLFRSRQTPGVIFIKIMSVAQHHPGQWTGFVLLVLTGIRLNSGVGLRRAKLQKLRSEEHTSELQSQFHLVCRLLLEKKNTSADSNQLS